MTEVRHFLDLDELDTATLRHILDLGVTFKKDRKNGREKPIFEGRVLALLFEKPSTRTRVSFEAGMKHLGGGTIVLSDEATQLGRGETIGDTARVLSRYVEGVMIRTDLPAKLDEMAKYSSIPVINGLTDDTHPCQIMADVMTFEERLGSIEGAKVAWCGDGNNVASSWVHAAVRFGFSLMMASPAGYQIPDELLAWARQEGGDVHITHDPVEAVKDAQCVVTDTWVSMNHKDRAARMKTLQPYQVNGDLIAHADKDAVFMHCLPAHRGEEVTDEVIDGRHSVVWDEAENRLHVQKGILAWCFGLK